MKVQARIVGAKELIRKNEKFAQFIENGAAVEDVLRQTVSDIKRDAPRNLGDLEKSVRWKRVGKYFKIYVSDWKASYHEYARRLPHGDVNNPLHYTSMSGKEATRPFIRPNVYKNMKLYKKVFHSALFKIYQGR